MRTLITAAIAASVGLSGTGCTLLLDSDPTQCEVDADCVKFGGQPICQDGACVDMGLGPDGCFFGTPQQPIDFLNQCSTAMCLPFDNAERLGIADGSQPPELIQPPAPTAPAATTMSGSTAVDTSLMPKCVDPDAGRRDVIVMAGSSNFVPLLLELAPMVAAAGFTPVFQITSSCAAIGAMFASDTTSRMIHDPATPTQRFAEFYTAEKTSVPCLLGPEGAQMDIGESEIFSTSCADFEETPRPANIRDFPGPNLAIVFAVPVNSRQDRISAEAAYEVFGRGGQSGMVPWNNPALYFIRNMNTATQQLIGRSVGVPANQFWGTDGRTASALGNQLLGITDPTLADQAIGIIAADFVDDNRGNLKTLAYQAPGQSCAYFPDSTPFSFDKQNVRDGHYPIWGPLHFYVPVVNDLPVSVAAQTFTNIVSVPKVPQELLDAFIASSYIHECAMRVRRTTELGSLEPFDPPFQCGCYFDFKTSGSPPAECTPCSNAVDDCRDPLRPACNFGFCERSPG